MARRARVVVPSWRAAGADAGRLSGSGGEGAAPVGVGTRVQAALSRGIAGGLWVVVGLALVLGVANCARATAAGPVTVPAPVPVAPPGGCAELVVAAWVGGEVGLLGVAARRSGEASWQAVGTFTAGVTRAAAPDTWGYLVGTQVRERDDEGSWHDAGLQFFAVTMVGTGAGCQGWSPAALPMRVPAPPLAVVSPDRYPVTLPSSGTALSEMLEAFFAGVLAGAGPVDRYVAPGAAIGPVVPAWYATARVDDIRAAAGAPVGRSGQLPADGTVVRLLVSVAVEPAPLPLVYPLTVAVRGGRWEVLAIDPLVGADAWHVPPHDPAAPPADAAVRPTWKEPS